MITLDAARLQQHELDEAARQFNELGFIEVVGLERVAVPAFESVLAERLGFSAESVKKMLSPAAGSEIFPLEVRQRLSRIPTPPDLAATLVSALGPLVSRLIGPLVHVSRDFHSQFKGGAVAGIDHYHHEGAAEYLEVHGAYLLHQDFTGASVPTSPAVLRSGLQ